MKRVALITGGTRGIGLAIVRELHHAGFTCIACSSTMSVDPDAIETELLDRVHWTRCDVSNDDEVKAMFAWILAEFGTLDILVNNAGIMAVAPIDKVNKEEATTMMRINYLGTLFCMQHAVPLMSGNVENVGLSNVGLSNVRVPEVTEVHPMKKLIINISSSSLDGGRQGHAAYAASKAAVQAMSACAALDLKASLQTKHIEIKTVTPRRTWTALRWSNFPDDQPEQCMHPWEVALAVMDVINNLETL